MVLKKKDKSDYEKTLASTKIICKPYDDKEFYEKAYKVIFRYPTNEYSTKTHDYIRNINFSVYQKLELNPLSRYDNICKRILNVVFVTNNKSIYNTLLTSMDYK